MINSSPKSDLMCRYSQAAVLQNSVGELNKIIKNSTLVAHWIGDTDCFWYRRETSTGFQFRLVDAKAATNTEAFNHELLGHALAKILRDKVNPENLPITKVYITLSPVKIYFTAFNGRYCFDSDTHQCHAAESEPDDESRERLLSPDGKKIAFVRDYNLWIRDVATGDEKCLTQDGEQNYSYATSPISWGLPIQNDLQAAWSPDSKRLFTIQTDNRQVKSMPIIQYVPEDSTIRPVLYQYPLACPGDEHIEEQRLLAIEVASGCQQEANYRRVPINRSAFGLFTDNQGWWSSDSQYAYFVDMERGDQIVRVVEFDTHFGVTRILFEERSNTHIRLSYNRDNCATILPIPGTQELIWYSDRSGWGHLYLYDLQSGKLKHPITQGNWVVRELLHFDSERRELWFQTSGRVRDRDPYYLDICRVNIDTGEVVGVISSDHEYTTLDSLNGKNIITYFHRLADPDWQPNTCGVAPSGRYLVTMRSRADQAPVSLLLNRDGEKQLEIETADVFGLPVGWQWPEPAKLLAADGETDIYGVVFRPSDFTPSKQYPIIDASLCTAEFSSVPKGSFNNAEMGGLWYLEAAALAELGFIVVMIDGRGTVYRDKGFSDFAYGSIPYINYAEDRISGIRQLSERYPYMDLNRVGIMGFNGMPGAVFGLLQHPDFYKVGVSHALQDSRINSALAGSYKGIQKISDYKTPPEQLVDNLQGKLLLMHGLMDKMDHSAATWRLVEALQQANKDFDMLVLPNEGQAAHIGSRYAFRRTWDYFVLHLQGLEPPKEFDLNAVAED